MKELLYALQSTAVKHPGKFKMLQEIPQQDYYPGMTKHVKRWLEGCKSRAKDKHVRNNAITIELPNLPERDLGPEDVMQIDLLTAKDTYQRRIPDSDGSNCCFRKIPVAYLPIEATVTNVAKVMVDIMTKH